MQPAANEPGKISRIAQALAPPRRKSRVLCVEDNADTQGIIAFVFRDLEIVFAESIRAAIAIIENENFDLYLLDNWLPDGSGIELCTKIRAICPRKPIIFASGVSTQKSVDDAMNAGADRYILKPVDPVNLRTIVKELLEPAA